MGANAIQSSCSDISVSTPSVRGFVSTRFRGTVSSGSTTFVSGSQSELIPHQSAAMEVSLDQQDVNKALNNDCSADLIDDEDFGVYASNPHPRQYPQMNGDYGHLPFDEIESCCEPENEEDEREDILVEDDDDDVTGETSCFGSRDLQSPYRSNEKHKNAVKYEVDLHFKFLIASMLPVEKLPVSEEGDPESWLEVITSLSLTIATLLIPHKEGRGMEPINYVKIKCLASGRPSDSTVVKGVVCKKNMAQRRMTSNLEKPRILILGGDLEYQRVSDLFASFDTLLQQEKDTLKMAVAKIDTYHPDILLSEKSVSRYDQEYLLAKDIALVQNIKRPLLERIARFTGGKIVQSIDQLSSQHLGYCDQFYVKRSLEEHGTTEHDGKKLVKTLMHFDGCPHPQGYNVLLRGANGDELKKAKHLLQLGIYMAYRRALSTSYKADELASLRRLQSAKTPSINWVQNTVDHVKSFVLACCKPDFALRIR